MENKAKIALIIRWTARIVGSLVVAFVLMFLLGDLFSDQDSAVQLTAKDKLTFVFFPGTTVVGLIVALKWEGLGGILTLLGLVGLIFVRPDLLSSLLIISIIAIPSFLYISYWAIKRI